MKKNFLILMVGVMLFSCHSNQLDRTIFIPDEDDRNLPAYSEWGYNSFGAEYERDYFLVSNYIVPCKILYGNNEMQFSLHGTIRYNQDMSLLFIFPSETMSSYADLLWLNNVEIDLSVVDCSVKMIQNGLEKTLDVFNGTLHFKRAQLLSIDDEVNRVILSGIFELNFLQNGFPTTISNGRFDMGITTNVFYSMP